MGSAMPRVPVKELGPTSSVPVVPGAASDGRAQRLGAVAAVEGSAGHSPVKPVRGVRLVAPPVEELGADIEHFLDVNRRTSANTQFGNLLDLCGLALPAGRAAHGMPASLLLSAPAGHEDRLLAAGMAVQALLPRPEWSWERS